MSKPMPYPGGPAPLGDPHDEPVVTFSYRELWQQLLHELHEIKTTIGQNLQALDQRVTRLEATPSPPNLEARVNELERANATSAGSKLAVKDLYALAATLAAVAGVIAALLK